MLNPTPLDRAETARLLQGILIPPQPRALLEVLTEHRKADPDLIRIAKSISTDVGMSAALLKAANSPAFGGNTRVTNIQQAVSRLGLRTTVSLVKGLALRMAMSGPKLSMEQFWETAGYTATVCSLLARRFRVMPADEAHMLGLFHDCGIPLLMQRFPNYGQVLQEAWHNLDRTLVAFEEAALRTNHAVVAYLVARAWQLPETVLLVIREHHNETLLIETQDPLAERIALLMLAEHLVHLFLRATEDHTWERTGSRVLTLLGLSDHEFEDLKEDVAEWLTVPAD